MGEQLRPRPPADRGRLRGDRRALARERAAHGGRADVVAFFLAIAFFLFLLWRERRGDLEAWSDLSRRTFYCAIVLAVVAIGALIALGPTGADAIAFFAVIACCVWAIWRVWRREHRYG